MQIAIGIGPAVVNGALPSAVNAGPNQVVTEAASEATLAAVILDDGNEYDLLWTKLSGPGDVTFDDDTAADAVATFSEPGYYKLLLTADDGEHPPVKGAMQVLVDAEPVVDAGEDQELEFSEELTFDLAGEVTDNGPVTRTWTKESGPGTVTFGDASDPASAGNTVSEFGTYVLRLTADDGVNDPVFDEVTIDVTEPA
ncbi:MAG TPA: hypothetical protein VHO25_10275 [Polyangiaceae bacterium]|nr:hypothetical protein [Polyangiaceae bacterium]